MIKISI